MFTPSGATQPGETPGMPCVEVGHRVEFGPREMPHLLAHGGTTLGVA
jgi:hypothetical protein